LQVSGAVQGTQIGVGAVVGCGCRHWRRAGSGRGC
jgi:hypothetical protein